MATVVFGGGCFWCTEAVFQMLKGVEKVESGYFGGSMGDPTYEQVSGGTTGHAECIKVTYDPDVVTYDDLLTVFFGSHSPHHCRGRLHHQVEQVGRLSLQGQRHRTSLHADGGRGCQQHECEQVERLQDRWRTAEAGACQAKAGLVAEPLTNRTLASNSARKSAPPTLRIFAAVANSEGCFFW